MSAELVVRRAVVADAGAVGRLRHDFNAEFDEPTPDSNVLAERVRALLAAGEMTVVLGRGWSGPAGGTPVPPGGAVGGAGVLPRGPLCRSRSPWPRIGSGDHGDGDGGRPAGRCDRDAPGHLEDDVAARALYGSLGFSNRDGKADGPANYFYEREL
jgi:hypothetical protein